MRTNVADFMLPPTATIEEALRTINGSRVAIGLVVDEGSRLLGLVTDGDIRRALLGGRDLSDGIDDVMTRQPRTVPLGCRRRRVLQLFEQHRLQHLPVVTDDHVLVGLHLLTDLLPAQRMRTDLAGFLCAPGALLRDVLHIVDQNRSGIALVADENQRLLGTITDGDVRRAVLGGANLDSPVDTAMNPSPLVSTPSADPTDTYSLMRTRRMRHLPVVDEGGELVGLHVLTAPHIADDLDQDLGAGVVLMAGGMGTRLRPYTETIPKPMIPVGDRPILEHIVEHLAASGIRDMVISTRYLAEQIEEHFGDGSRWSAQISYLAEGAEGLGTAGCLRRLQGRFDSPFLVMNADVFSDFGVANMLSFHRDHRASLTLAVRQYSFKVPYGVVDVDGVRVGGLQEKPEYEFFVNAGIYVLDPEVLDLIPSSGPYHMTQLIERLLADGQSVISFPILGTWIDIGQPDDLERANLLYQRS